MGVMYAIAGEPKMMTFSGPTESRHPLTNSFRHSRVVVASVREFQRLFRGYQCWSRCSPSCLVIICVVVYLQISSGVQLFRTEVVSCNLLPSIKIW
jgi:hypothetical protein